MKMEHDKGIHHLCRTDINHLHRKPPWPSWYRRLPLENGPWAFYITGCSPQRSPLPKKAVKRKVSLIRLEEGNLLRRQSPLWAASSTADERTQAIGPMASPVPASVGLPLNKLASRKPSQPALPSHPTTLPGHSPVTRNVRSGEIFPSAAPCFTRPSGPAFRGAGACKGMSSRFI